MPHSTRACSQLGVKASEAEIGEFFDQQLDMNSDGTMDFEEARTAFRLFRKDAESWDKEREELKAKVNAYKLDAHKAQTELERHLKMVAPQHAPKRPTQDEMLDHKVMVV